MFQKLDFLTKKCKKKIVPKTRNFRQKNVKKNVPKTRIFDQKKSKKIV